MKSYYTFGVIVILIILLNMLMPCSSVLAEPDDEVIIDDSGLSDAIALVVGPPPFTESELGSIKYLNGLYFGISDLTGLEYCTNLEYLYLDINNISNISALSGLTKLKELGLYCNNISDITALSGPTNLQGLDLSENSISDITALSGLINLVYLDLYGNNISNITALAGLTNLVYLYLGINNISDVSALSSLTNLNELGLSGNDISDISALSGLTNLGELGLGGNNISDISVLSGLTNLQGLDLTDNDISDITALSGLTKIRNLYLAYNNISDIEPLVNNTGLGFGDFVDLRYNPLNDVSISNYIPELQDRWVTLYINSPVTNEPPDADANGPYDIDEGETVTLDGSGSTDPDKNIDLYEWDLDDDGQYDDATGETTTAVFNDNGVYTVGLKVTDAYDEYDIDTSNVTVNDLGPMAEFSWSPDPQNEGAVIAFADTSVSSPDVIVSWDWDFAGLDVSNEPNPSFTFTDNGTYTVTLTVTDDDGSTDIATLSVTVNDLGPTAVLSCDTVLDEGQEGNYDASGSTSNPDAIVLYEWDWDYDGSNFNPSDDNGAVQTHTWNDNGTYTVAVRVTDDDGSIDTATLSVTVANLAPEVNAVSDQPINLGDPVTVTVEFTDPGILDTHTANISWGDESSDQATVDPITRTFSGSHVYTWPGSYTVTVKVTDDDGGVGSNTFTVMVLPVPDEMIESIGDEIDEIELPTNVENSLTASLDTANKVLDDSNQNNDAAAINSLEAFINKLEAQRGKKIPVEVADELIAMAQEILDALSGES